MKDKKVFAICVTWLLTKHLCLHFDCPKTLETLEPTRRIFCYIERSSGGQPVSSQPVSITGQSQGRASQTISSSFQSQCLSWTEILHPPQAHVSKDVFPSSVFQQFTPVLLFFWALSVGFKLRIVWRSEMGSPVFPSHHLPAILSPPFTLASNCLQYCKSPVFPLEWCAMTKGLVSGW